MEYFEVIRTIEVDVTQGGLVKSCRVEVLRSSHNDSWYRIKLMELRDYNMYPGIFNTAADGSDLHHFHSADRLWYEVPVVPDEFYTGLTASSDEEALQRGLRAVVAAYPNALQCAQPSPTVWSGPPLRRILRLRSGRLARRYGQKNG